MTELTIPDSYSYDLTHAVPGRVLCLPGDHYNGERTWLYIVHRDADSITGVRFENANDAARVQASAEWHTLPVTALRESDTLTHPLSVVEGWAPGLAAFFLAAPGTTTTPGTSSDVTSALEQGRREGRRAAEQDFAAWKARAEEIAHTYADENDLCSEFDRCMEEVGLSPRGGRTFDVTYRVTIPRGNSPHVDAEDLYNVAEEGAGSPWRVEEV